MGFLFFTNGDHNCDENTSPAKPGKSKSLARRRGRQGDPLHATRLWRAAQPSQWWSRSLDTRARAGCGFPRRGRQ
ncbi:hypothetical protein FKM82_026944 [Ascaphus truei]